MLKPLTTQKKELKEVQNDMSLIVLIYYLQYKKLKNNLSTIYLNYSKKERTYYMYLTNFHV